MRNRVRHIISAFFVLLSFFLPLSNSQAASINFDDRVSVAGSFTYDPRTNVITGWNFTEAAPPPHICPPPCATNPPDLFTYTTTNSAYNLETLSAGGSYVSFYRNLPPGAVPPPYPIGPYPQIPESVLSFAIDVTLSPTLTLSDIAQGVPLLTHDANDCLHGLDLNTGVAFTFCSDEYFPPGIHLVSQTGDNLRNIVQPAFLLPSDPPLGPVTFTLVSVPEPASILLIIIGSGLAGLNAWRRKTRVRLQGVGYWACPS
jgi:PEP-CTERM motif-containing protein